MLEDLIGLHRTVQLQFLQHWGIDLDDCDVEWFALETNQDHLLLLRLHPSTAFPILVDYEGYSISSKGLLPTVVDMMVV